MTAAGGSLIPTPSLQSRTEKAPKSSGPNELREGAAGSLWPSTRHHCPGKGARGMSSHGLEAQAPLRLLASVLGLHCPGICWALTGLLRLSSEEGGGVSAQRGPRGQKEAPGCTDPSSALTPFCGVSLGWCNCTHEGTMPTLLTTSHHGGKGAVY